MTTNHNSKSEIDPSNIYRVRLKGRLDQHWSEWFEGLTVKPQDDGTTLLIGPVIDDAALHGLLKKVRDSGLQLVSINLVEPDQVDEVDSEKTGGSRYE